MELWTIWIIVAIVLAIVEVLTQMMWALCLTIGALGAMICSLCDVPIAWQIVVLAVLAIIAYAALLPFFKRWHNKSDRRQIRTGMDALLGRRAIVTQAIEPERMGRVRIDGDNWQVKAPGVSDIIPVGDEVVVNAYESNILTVEPC
ncbi:MAG: NfeD family protein [Muribaculaceae bacterium]|nr:NfeD family protein [Muribaculaceae bacterium]